MDERGTDDRGGEGGGRRRTLVDLLLAEEGISGRSSLSSSSSTGSGSGFLSGIATSFLAVGDMLVWFHIEMRVGEQGVPKVDSKVCCRGFLLRPPMLSGEDVAACFLLGLPSCAARGDENRTLAGDSPSPGSGELLAAAGETGSKMSLC